MGYTVKVHKIENPTGEIQGFAELIIGDISIKQIAIVLVDGKLSCDLAKYCDLGSKLMEKIVVQDILRKFQNL